MEVEPDLRPQSLLPSWRASLAAVGAGVLVSMLFVWFDPVDRRVDTLSMFVILAVLGIPCQGVPLLAICATLHWLNKGEWLGHSAARVSRGVFLCILFVIAHIPGWAYDSMRIRRAQRAAQGWCEALVPRLDAWRAQHESYPARIEDLGADVVHPPLFREELSYKPTTTGFQFDIPDPATFIIPSGYQFSSERREWTRYH